MTPPITLLKYPFRTVDGKDPLIGLLRGLLSEKKTVCCVAPSERRALFLKSLFPGERFKACSPDSLALEIIGERGKKLFCEEHRALFLISLLDSNPVVSGLFGKTPGTLSILLDLINDLKLGLHHRNLPGLRETINNDLSGSDRVLKRSLAAVDMLEAYCGELASAGAYDKADLPVLASAMLRTKGFLFGQAVFDGFYDLPAAQKEFFAEIIKNSAGTAAVIRGTEGTLELDSGDNEFYAFIKDFKGAAEKAAVQGAPARFPSGVKAAKAMSREDEVRWQAAEILKLTAGGKAKAEEIAVTFPSMYVYFPYVRRVFGELGIEFSSSFENDLSTFPQIIAVVNLLECVLEGYPRRRLTEVVTSPLFTGFSGLCKSVIPFASRDAGIVSGEKEWSELAARLAEERGREGFYAEKKEELKKAGAEINAFITRSRPAEELTLSGFSAYVSALLELAGCRAGAEGPLSGLQSLLSAINSYRGAGADKKHSFKYLCRTFVDLLKKAKYGSSGGEKGVRVLGILETRGIEARHIFFGGLNDGEYPLRPKQEMVMPDRLRKKLGLTSFERRISLQKFHFRRLLESPLDGIHLSYPAQDNDRLLFPSNFLPADLPAFNVSGNAVFARASLPEGGGIKEPQVKELPETALKEFGPEMFINVTAFDAYIKCPYSFYLERILKLRPFKEPSYEVDGALYGSIMHEAMQSAVKSGKKIPGGTTGFLETALNESLRKERLTAFWKDFIRAKVFKAASAIGKQELKLAGEFPEVFCVEKKLSGELIPGVLKARGRVDRIDSAGGSLLIIDYKTGALAGTIAGLTSRYESLQLPLYAALIEKELPGLTTKELAVFDLTEGTLNRVRTKDLRSLIEEAVIRAGKIAEAVRRGEFPRQKSAKCRYCGYAGSCRGADFD